MLTGAGEFRDRAGFIADLNSKSNKDPEARDLEGRLVLMGTRNSVLTTLSQTRAFFPTLPPLRVAPFRNAPPDSSCPAWLPRIRFRSESNPGRRVIALQSRPDGPVKSAR